jgi:hypothetical protein
MSIIGNDVDPTDLVIQKRRDFLWAFENLDDNNVPVDFPAGSLYFELVTGGEHNCVQQIEILQAEGGTYRLSYNGVQSDPIDYYEPDTSPYDLTIDVRSALENIPAIGDGNVKVSTTGLTPVWNLNFILAGTSRNEIQSLKVDNLLGWLGQQLGEGDMVLSYRESDTVPIRFEANAAEVEAALEALPQIGVGNVNVTEPQTGEFLIEYVGMLAARDVDLITVRAYEKNAGDFFGGGITGNLLTQFQTKTVQNGRRAILDGRMMDLLTRKVNDFFSMFDDALSIDLVFEIDSNVDFTIVCRSTTGYEEVDLLTFDVLFNASTLQTYLNNQLLLSGAILSVTVDQYWNHSYTVEFINGAANKPHPQLVGVATALTNNILGLVLQPAVKTTILELGQAPLTKWEFDITGSTADLRVESEYVDRIRPRTKWQLVFLPDGEAAGGQAITRGTVRVQE